MEKNAAYWKAALQLESHIEGGAFREIYRSRLVLPQAQLPAACQGNRNAATCIYFLLENKQYSAWHRLAADELWHFYTGSTLHIYEIKQDGELVTHRLGNNPDKGEGFVAVVSGGSWLAAQLPEGDYALVGCTMAPGFDFADFELGRRDALLEQYPQHRELVEKLSIQP